MKNNWFKNYRLLNKKNPSRQFQDNVRNSVLMNINQYRMEGSNNMNIKKPVKWLSIVVAVALLGTASVIGVDASTDGAISNKIKLFINGEPVDNVTYISSGENDDGSYYYEVEIGDSDELNTDNLDVTLTITLGCNNHLEKDENGHLWVKCEDDDTLSVDITDELNKNGTYTYFSTDENGNILQNIVSGNSENYTVDTQTQQVAINDIE